MYEERSLEDLKTIQEEKQQKIELDQKRQEAYSQEQTNLIQQQNEQNRRRERGFNFW